MFLQNESVAFSGDDNAIHADQSVNYGLLAEAMAQADQAWYSLNEAAMMSQHNVIVNEAGKGIVNTIKDWFKGVKKWLVEQWNAFTGWVKDAYEKVKNYFTSDKKWLAANKKSIEGFKGKFDAKDVSQNVLDGKLLDGLSNITALFQQFNAANDQNLGGMQIQSVLDKASDALYKKAGGKSGEETISKATRTVVLGKTVKKVSIDKGVVAAIFGDISKLDKFENITGAQLKAVSAQAKLIEKVASDAAKAIEKDEMAGKDGLDGEKNGSAASLKSAVEKRRKLLGNLQTMLGVTTSAVNSGRSQGMSILREAVKNGDKSTDKKDDKKEDDKPTGTDLVVAEEALSEAFSLFDA